MIVMHGVLTLFPEAERLAYMRRVAAWLAPQGALISSVQFGEKVGADEPSKRIAQALENLQVLLDEAGGYPQEFARDMRQRVERGLRDRHGHRNPFPDREAVRPFYGSTGLEAQSLDIVGERNDGGPKRRYSGRSIAVCRPGAGRMNCGRSEKQRQQPTLDDGLTPDVHGDGSSHICRRPSPSVESATCRIRRAPEPSVHRHRRPRRSQAEKRDHQERRPRLVQAIEFLSLSRLFGWPRLRPIVSTSPARTSPPRRTVPVVPATH